ncbi:MAG: hypothetical protein L0958_05415, partial [Candidatus Mariimomonas ferrooxydans]
MTTGKDDKGFLSFPLVGNHSLEIYNLPFNGYYIMRKIGVIAKKGSKTAIDSVKNLLSFIDKKKFKVF